jgi:hypothetical protein
MNKNANPSHYLINSTLDYFRWIPVILTIEVVQQLLMAMWVHAAVFIIRYYKSHVLSTNAIE